MKKTQKMVAVAATALGLLFGMSCRKTPTESVSTPTSTSSAWTKSALFSSLRTAPFKFSVDAGVPSVGYGPQGTKLVFYVNSFKDGTGNVISSGKIDIELIEMYTPGSMIANNAVTTCNGQLLRSGGQLKITATQNGKEVYANRYGIGFKQPEASSDPMELFYSDNNSLDSTTVWEQPDTMRNRLDRMVLQTMSDTTYKPGLPPSITHYYMFDSCTRFRWVNCDFFYSNPAPRTDIYVQLSDTSFNYLNSAVFLVIVSDRAVASTSYQWSTKRFLGRNFPEGQSMKLVFMGKIGDSHFYAEKIFEVSREINLPLTPLKVTSAEIKTKLAGF